MANDAHAVLHFRQALVLDETGHALAVSGLVKLAEDSPYLLWLKRAWPWVVGHLPAEGGWFAPTADMLADTAGDVADGWQEWWPAGVFALPLRRRAGELLGWVLFLLDQPPAAECRRLAGAAGTDLGYCWEMLAGKPRPGWHTRWQALSQSGGVAGCCCAGFVCFLPVRQTALAPAEVAAGCHGHHRRHSMAWSRRCMCVPTRPVKAGDAAVFAG